MKQPPKTRKKRIQFPTMAVVANGLSVTPNNLAKAHLLSSGSEFVALVMDEKGVVGFHPLDVPGGTIGVSRLVDPKETNRVEAMKVAFRHAANLNPAYQNGKRYYCVWEEEDQILRMTLEEAPN